MRCTLFFLAALILPGLRPADARAQFTWLQPDWQTTQNISYSPTDAFASATLGSTAADVLSAHVYAGASNPPGPGGGTASVFFSFQRSFQITSPTNVTVPLRLTVDGSTFTDGPSAQFSTVVGVTPYGMLQQVGAIDNQTIAFDQTYPISLASGTYTINGSVSAGASATSGPGLSANANFVVTFGLASTPIPEPGLLAAVGGLALATFRRRTRRTSQA